MAQYQCRPWFTWIRDVCSNY